MRHYDQIDSIFFGHSKNTSANDQKITEKEQSCGAEKQCERLEATIAEVNCTWYTALCCRTLSAYHRLVFPGCLILS